MKVLVIKWIVAVLVLFSTATVYAEKSETTEAAEAAPRFEVETYLKMGGLGFYENGHSEGHKFFVGGELKVGSPLRPGAQFFLSVSGWRLGEAPDEDKEMPLQGGRIGGEFRHNFMIKDLLIYPFVGTGINYMEREGKIMDDDWSEITYIDCRAGTFIKFKWLFASAAVQFPIDIGNNGRHLKPDIGYTLDIGFNFKKFVAGYRYEVLAFHNPGIGKTAIDTSQAIIGWKF